eukprot:Partr_v1_DN23964_c0_g1_i4_m49057 putative 16 kDa proteolipid subunit
MGVMRPDLIMKCVVPVIMAGIIGTLSELTHTHKRSSASNQMRTGIYGLVVGVLIIGEMKQGMALYSGFLGLASGLSVGFGGLAAGISIGVVGDAGVRATGQQPRVFVGMILILIFAEVLGLYGLIISLILTTSKADGCTTMP